MHPLAAPGTLWVLSRVGKYLVRPQADETSHEKQIPCGRQEKGLPFFFPYHKGFRLCGGDQRAFRSPFGNLRPFAASRNLYIKQLPCGRQEKGLPFFSRIAKGFASAEATRGLSGRPLETFGPLLQCKIGICKKAFSCCWQETGLPFFRIAEKNFPINKANLPQGLTPCGRQITIIISPIP